MEEKFVSAWVASIPGIGPRRYEELILLFPQKIDLYTRSLSELMKRGVPERLAHIVVSYRTRHSPEEIETYCRMHGVKVITRSDPQYPRLLHEINDPPIVLYTKGELPLDVWPKIAVVGTRRITEYGEDVTASFTKSLVEEGFVIVSGFMYGVDAVAHRTALSNNGKTVGVLGFGFEYMYPKEHRQLASEMILTGNCLVSEYAPWQPPVPGNFPARNRIVSGMCVGILVTEAAAKSGSKITARLANEQGREVFAVPGPIHSPFSEGTKELVNMGATLVTNVSDIREEIDGLLQYTLI